MKTLYHMNYLGGGGFVDGIEIFSVQDQCIDSIVEPQGLVVQIRISP
jgi:hypothetical protein